jgi:hypothetical protein
MRPALLIVPTLLVCAVACDGTKIEVLASPPTNGDGGALCSVGGDAGGNPVEGGVVDDGEAPDAGKGAHGDTWPTYAHDFQRTSRATGAGAITSPEIAWTKPMGGLLGVGTASVADVDGDGRPNVVAVSGGRVTATNPDGSTLWQGPGASAVLGIWNLDGVGTPEVVVDTGGGAVLVLDGADGHTLTSLANTLPAHANFAPVGPTGGILVVGTTRTQLAGYDFR